jgi:hypothetical protein
VSYLLRAKYVANKTIVQERAQRAADAGDDDGLSQSVDAVGQALRTHQRLREVEAEVTSRLMA